jgi:hypothetical protein
VLAGGLGNGTYFVTQNNSVVDAQVVSGSSTGIITFGSAGQNPSGPHVDVSVGFSDGRSVQTVTVHVPGTCGA